MGLDMFLFKFKSIVKSNQKTIPFTEWQELYYKSWKKGRERMTFGELEKLDLYELVEIGDWRKANQIHKWFVDNVQNGNDDKGYYKVERAELELLLDTVKKVKQSLENKEYIEKKKTEFGETYVVKVFQDKDLELAKELLPTQDGFFFGSTEYDSKYMKNLNLTIEILEKALKDNDFENGDFYYMSDW